MTERCDVVVIGAGVVGLAVGRELALAGRDVLVLERHDLIGSETSSRNSEVIHAGIYYPTGSVKAEMCVRGKRLLYDYCETHQVPHARVGKIIVATNEDQRTVLDGYRAQALANGVGELRWLSMTEVAQMEPDVACVAAVFSETTGIIDSHAYMLSLQGELEANGGFVSLNTAVLGLAQHGEDLLVTCDGLTLAPRLVVNSAGLTAPQLSRQVAGDARGYFAKGHYYALSGRSPFKHLVYPVAEPGGLGVHVTLDMGGQAKFGPDVMWIDEVDYDFDSANGDRFVAAITKYYPGLDPARLHPSYTGIRPKLAPAGGPATDFVIQGPAQSGAARLINLLGIESPGLTASLAIAARVRELAGNG